MTVSLKIIRISSRGSFHWREPSKGFSIMQEGILKEWGAVQLGCSIEADVGMKRATCVRVRL